jgi:H+-transporting ATPase
MKKILQVLLLAVGLVMTGHAVLTPMLMVIVMITGDFLAMSLTTDRVRPSKMPNSWQIGELRRRHHSGNLLPCLLHGDPGSRQIPVASWHRSTPNLSVVGIVFGSQATTYVIRGRQHSGGLRPSFGSCFLRWPTFLSFQRSRRLESQWRHCPLRSSLASLPQRSHSVRILDVVKIPVFARLPESRAGGNCGGRRQTQPHDRRQRLFPNKFASRQKGDGGLFTAL